MTLILAENELCRPIFDSRGRVSRNEEMRREFDINREECELLHVASRNGDVDPYGDLVGWHRGAGRRTYLHPRKFLP